MKYIPYNKLFDYLPGGLSKHGNYIYYKYSGKSKTFKKVYSYDYSKTRPPLIGDDTGLSETQAWIALHKAWIAFKAYKSEDNQAMMEKYANIVNVLKKKLGFDSIEFYSLL